MAGVLARLRGLEQRIVDELRDRLTVNLYEHVPQLDDNLKPEIQRVRQQLEVQN